MAKIAILMWFDADDWEIETFDDNDAEEVLKRKADEFDRRLEEKGWDW